jgi:GTPase
MMKNEDDIVNCAKNMCEGGRLVPMLQISNVTGEGLNLLRLFLNLLPSKQEWKKATSDSVEFCIDDSFQVTGVGTVVSGNMFKGSVDCSNSKQRIEMLLGPDEFGEFKSIVIKSVHTRGIPVDMAQAGMSASFAIKAGGSKTKKIERSMIRKGMVIVDPRTEPRAAFMFEAEVVILHHPTTIQPGYQPVVHMRTARQAAKVVTISKPLLRSGDRATVTFRFSYRPEYVIQGVSIIFREGRTKGQGVITRVIYEDEMEAINAQKFTKASP